MSESIFLKHFSLKSEIKVIRERTLDGIHAMVEQGKYPYPFSPFGWDKDEELHLSVNEEQAYIVNRIGDMCIEGYSFLQIKSMLQNDYGLVRSFDILKKWVTREINTGIFTYHGKVYDNIVPAIMSEQKRQKIIKSIRVKSREGINQYWFYNYVFCSCGEKCIHKCTIKKERIFYYYYCPKCKKRMNQDKILEQILTATIFMDKSVQIENKVQKKLKELSSIQKKIKRLSEDYSEDLIDHDTFLLTAKKLKEKKRRLDSSISTYTMEGRLVFNDLTPEQKQAYFRERISYITINTELGLVIDVVYKKDLIEKRFKIKKNT